MNPLQSNLPITTDASFSDKSTNFPVVICLEMDSKDIDFSEKTSLEISEDKPENRTEKCISKNPNEAKKLIGALKLPQDRKTCNLPLFKCVPCDKVFGKEEYLRRHIAIHTSLKKYYCKICCKCFLKPNDLKVHICIQTRDKPFNCSECETSFAKVTRLKEHMYQIHGGGQAKKSYVCKICKKRYLKRPELILHELSHTGERPYPCNECDKAFARVSSLTIHVQRVHRNEKSPVCFFCQKLFSSSTDLKYHLQSHTGEREYFCTKCDKSFGKPSELKNHIILHHKSQTGSTLRIQKETKKMPLRKALNRNKFYQCKPCGKPFFSASNLKQHIDLHHQNLEETKLPKTSLQEIQSSYKTSKNTQARSNDKISCLECGSVFAKPSNLKRHLTNVHKSNGKTNSNLPKIKAQAIKSAKKSCKNSQARTTDTISCFKCGLVFARPYNLKRHLTNVHKCLGKTQSVRCKTPAQGIKSTEKACKNAQTPTADIISCSECQSVFARPYNLKRHLANVHKIFKNPMGNTNFTSDTDRTKTRSSTLNLPLKQNSIDISSSSHNSNNHASEVIKCNTEETNGFDSNQLNSTMNFGNFEKEPKLEKDLPSETSSLDCGETSVSAVVDMSFSHCAEQSDPLLPAMTVSLEQFNKTESSLHFTETFSNQTSEVVKSCKQNGKIELPKALSPVICIPQLQFPAESNLTYDIKE